jgi:hypothetical protein
MAISINGNGTITGISAGGLPAGTVTSATLASGAGGKILQTINTTLTAEIELTIGSGAIVSYNNAALRVAITASNASNKFLILGNIVLGSNGLAVSCTLQDNGTNIATATGDASGNRRRSTAGGDSGNTEGVFTQPIMAYITAGDTNQHIFNYAFWHNGGGSNSVYINGSQSGVDSNKRGRYISNITVMEIAA